MLGTVGRQQHSGLPLLCAYSGLQTLSTREMHLLQEQTLDLRGVCSSPVTGLLSGVEVLAVLGMNSVISQSVDWMGGEPGIT